MAPNGDMSLFGGATSTASPAHRSIGEVLALLKEEFPDITISKIRFLESQGLLDPERTPSGYRRFYEKDVERLRWILRQQRENFLPLKVIKGRLAEGLDTPAPAGAPDAEVPAPEPGNGDAEPQARAPGSLREPPPEPAPEPAQPPAAGPAAAPPRRLLPEPALFTHRGGAEHGRGLFTGVQSSMSVSLTAEELAAACAITVADVGELERYGLIEHRPLGATHVFDEDALLVARAAALFLAHGIEARHLRMYKVAADRESGVLEQVVLPLLHQRNPEARRRALDTVEELARLGTVLHSAMLRRALKNLT